MKKLLIIIVILAIVFIGMFTYKKTNLISKEIKVEEIEKIEEYIHQIYMWKEITKEALPCFDDINQADETWIWEVVKKNLEEYELSYEEIQKEAKEIFGENLKKEFPKEGTEYLIYDEETNYYYALGMGLDQEEDMFLLNKIQKTKDGYEVEIAEYLEDYSQAETEDLIIVLTTSGEELGKVSNAEEEKAKELAKSNIDKLSKKKIILKKEKEKIQVERVVQ